MPVVQKLTLSRSIGEIPQGTQILIVTKSESDRSTTGILRALRRAGFTDEQFNSNDLLNPANWKYMVMKNEDPGELNLLLSRFSQPIYAESSNPVSKPVTKGSDISHLKTSSNDDEILTGGYWDFWKSSLGNLFWVFFIFLVILWIPWGILKFILKFFVWLLVNILNICTFGILDLDTDWDDIFD